MAARVARQVQNLCRHGVPPRYRSVHNLPNKLLTSQPNFKILKTKEIVCKIFKTPRLCFFSELWETQA
jgi:hypothetical protein